MARPLQITDETILEALAAHPEVTSAEVAETLGIGQSTAAKRLAALESAGSVRRTPGGREAGRRAPDRWSPIASAVGTAPESPGLPTTPESSLAVVTAESDEVVAAGAVAATPVAIAEANDDAAGTESGRRLGRGELGSLVRDYLAARPDESFGPSAVGKALGRSQGAISNSLATMAAKGDVILIGDKPRRYRIAAGS